MAYMIEQGADISFTEYDLFDADGKVTHNGASMKFQTVLDFYSHLLQGNPINGCTVIMSKRLLSRVGLFDETLPFTHDYDLWLRIILTRADFYYFNYPTVQYRVHEQAGSVRQSRDRRNNGFIFCW